MKTGNKTQSLLFCLIMIAFCKCGEEKVDVPVITSFTPLKAKVESEITINGINFSPIDTLNKVYINGVRCPLISSSSNRIVTKALLGVNTGKISVTVNSLSASATKDFTLIPHKFNVNPMEGSIGDVVNISGLNFTENLMDSFNVFFYDSIRIKATPSVTGYTTDDATGITSFNVTVPTGAKTGNLTIRLGPVEVDSDSIFTIVD